MEIICISCWRAFDHDTSTSAAQVTCPHCGFSQPGPDPSSLSAKLDANTRPSEVASEGGLEAQDTSTTDPEMPVMTPEPPEPSPSPVAAPEPKAQSPRPQTMDFGAVPMDESPAGHAPQAPEAAPEPAAPPKPDHRWRLRTPARLVLYFSDYEALSRYLSGDEGAGYSVACGPGPFRTLTGFISAMRVTNDPLEALVNVPPDDETAPLGSLSPPQDSRPQQAPSGQPSATRPSSKPSQASSPSRSSKSSDSSSQSQPRSRTRRRRTSANTDFSFRKQQEQNPWPGRVLFLLLGMLLGSAAIYYVAWIGLLPGIVY